MANKKCHRCDSLIESVWLRTEFRIVGMVSEGDYMYFESMLCYQCTANLTTFLMEKKEVER